MSRRMLVLAVVAATFGLYAPEARANAALAFVINNRSPNVPAARVRWSFALAGPAAGSTVTIGGETATLGGGFKCVGDPGCATTTSDRFRLDAAPALTNGVSFLYEIRSHFVGGDRCTLAAGVTLPKTVNFNFTGPTITQHAIVTYTVAGTTAATTFFCQQARRRVSTATATITTAPPGATALSRHPIDVILVLDKSGSMGWELPGAPFNSLPTRNTVLQTALDQFEALWEQASESDVGGDRLSVVHFDSNASQPTFGGSFFKRRDGAILGGQTHAWDEVLAAAKAPSPGGSTAIGKGLNLAIKTWIADPNTFDAAIVLMTDGEQNVSPEIVKVAGTNDWALDDPDDANPAVELYRRGLPIQTIGFGTPADVEAQLLGGIAEQTAGTSIVTATATGLSSAMQDVLLQALKGNTIGLLARTDQTIGPPPPNPLGTPVKIQVDPSVQRVTFVLSWEGRPGLFEVLVQAPGGGTPVPFTVRKDGATWQVASIDIPASGPGGEWTAIVRGRDMSTPAAYRLSAYAVDRRLKYAVQFNRGRTGTGDPLRLMAEISHNGAPLTGIPGGVRISLATPSEGLGNILHETTEVSGGTPPVPDPPSAYKAKVLALARSGALAKTEPRPTGSQLTLRDDGSGGDEFANDGVYSATVTDTSVPGRYRLGLRLEWDDPRTGKVRRTETLEREVEVVPSPAQTVVEVLPAAPDGSFTVRVTPRDRFRNYMGPGYGNRFTVTLTNGSLVGAIADPSLTGTYTFRVGNITPGTTPTATITVDNVTVQTGMPVVPGVVGGTSGTFAVWFGLGATVPQGTFANTHGKGLAANFGVEYMHTPAFSIEGTIGWHRFNGKNAGPDTDILQIAGNGKWYLGQTAWRPFVLAGAGVYRFDPGSVRLGVQAGAGVQGEFAPQWSVEGRYIYHRITDNAPRSAYATLQVGLRFAF